MSGRPPDTIKGGVKKLIAKNQEELREVLPRYQRQHMLEGINSSYSREVGRVLVTITYLVGFKFVVPTEALFDASDPPASF